MAGGSTRGAQFEDYARDCLAERGLRLLKQNYHCRFGEIDLIMQDGETICFIEVKFRKSLHFGGAANAIPMHKQRKIIKTAMFYIAQNRHLANQAFRFDAFLIQQQADGSNQVNWIKGAFYGE
jgi:putative endonuclease